MILTSSPDLRSHIRKAEDFHFLFSQGSEDDDRDRELRTFERMDSIKTYFKYMVGVKDQKLEELKSQISPLKNQDGAPEAQGTQLVSENPQPKDQGTFHNGQPCPHKDGNSLQVVRSELQEEIEELKRSRALLQSQLAAKDSLIEYLKSVPTASAKPEPSPDATSTRDSKRMAEFKQELMVLKSELQTQSLEICKVQELLKSEAFARTTSIRAPQVTDAEDRFLALLQEIENLKNENRELSEQRNMIKRQLDSANRVVTILQHEKSRLQMNMTDSQKEYDDLLVLLDAQKHKIVSLMQKLKDCGHPDEDEDGLIEDDDDDEEEDGGMNPFHI